MRFNGTYFNIVTTKRSKVRYPVSDGYRPASTSLRMVSQRHSLLLLQYLSRYQPFECADH